MEITEPKEEKPVELGITKGDKISITLRMEQYLGHMNDICGLIVLSWNCRHLFWESEKRHEWHFIIETTTMKKAFSIWKDTPYEVITDLMAMSGGLVFLASFRLNSVTYGLESEAATKLLQMGGSSAEKWLYADKVRK